MGFKKAVVIVIAKILRPLDWIMGVVEEPESWEKP